jgi:hypothetical protein
MMFAGSKAPAGFTFSLRGDLDQIGLQKKILQEHDIIVKQSDVYPVLREEDKRAAMRVIWDSQVKGWWHYYKEIIIEQGICTEKDWNTARAVVALKESASPPKEEKEEERQKERQKPGSEATPQIERKINWKIEKE